MKILIIGSSGLVGSALTSYFANIQDCELFSASRNSGNYRFDCCQSFDYSDLFGAQYFDLVVCCVNTYSQDLDTSIATNVDSVKNILQGFCGRCGHIIFISSFSALPQNAAKNVYNTTKAIAEDIIRLYLYQGTQPITILRFGQLFDQNGKAKKSQNGLYYFIDSLNSNSPIRVYTKNEKPRNFFPVEDIGKIISFAYFNSLLGEYNIVSNFSVTNSKLITYLSTNSRYDLSLVEYDPTKEAISYYFPDCSKEFEQVVKSIQVKEALKKLIR